MVGRFRTMMSKESQLAEIESLSASLLRRHSRVKGEEEKWQRRSPRR